MIRYLKKTRAEIGESPFEMRFRGKQKSDSVLLRIIDFNIDTLTEQEINSVEDSVSFAESETVTWLNVDGLHDASIIEKLGEQFELDRMISSNVLDTEQRPTMFDFESCLYISVRMLTYNEETEEISAENICLVIKPKLLISYQERRGDVFEPVRDRIRHGKRKLRKSGTDYLAFTLLDVVVDHYLFVLSALGEKIEELESTIWKNSSQEVLEELSDLKGEISFVKRSIAPAREAIFAIAKLETDLINKKANGVHWKDLQANISLAVETADGYRDMLSDMLNMYHTTVSTKLNDIMKFLTIFSAIFIPLTFIAGIYGTNFDNIPELHYTYGYHVMLFVMVIVTSFMVFYFKRKKWF